VAPTLLTIVRPVPGNGGHALLSVQGPPVFDAGGRLRDAVAELVDAGQPWLLLDLSWTTRLDRAGLAVLVFIRRRLRAAGGCLHLFDRSWNASRALAGPGLGRLLPVHGSLAQAAARDAR